MDLVVDLGLLNPETSPSEVAMSAFAGLTATMTT